MNVELYANVKPGISVSKTNLKISRTDISEPNGANRVPFLKVFQDGSSNDAIHTTCCTPLVDLLISGYNVSMVVCGSSKSACIDVVNGTDRDAGIFVKVLQTLYDRLDEEQSIGREGVSSLGARKDFSTCIGLVELGGDGATDLVSARANLDIEEDAEHGDWFRLAAEKRFYSVAEGKQLFQTSWQQSAAFSRRDSSNSHHSLVASIDLIMHFETTVEPHKSKFSFIILPSVEGLVHDAEQSQSVKLVEGLLSDLSAHQHPDRVINYSDSALTKLVQNELGGNCITKVVACFDPLADLRVQREFLGFCKRLGKVKNFPIMNDSYAQQLITQYRAGIIHWRKLPAPRTPPVSHTPLAPAVRMGTPVHRSFQPEPRYVPDQWRYDNARLLEQVERLQLKLEQLNSKFSIMASSKAELSAQLVESEEEKLKATKAYIDMQIQNNRLREEMESNSYDLTNKILTLEHDLQLSEMEREKLGKESSNLRYQFTQLETERRSLADEYINLKTNYMSLTDDCEREIARNEELTMELLNLINAKSALARQSDSRKYSEESNALAREEDRIRALVHRLSHGGTTMERLRPDRKRKDFIEKELFGTQSKYQEQMNRMNEDFSEGKQQLQGKLESMEKELSSLRSLARQRQQKISFLNARLITLSGDNTELKTVNNRLQHKVKDINEEYRLRLTKYVEDVASHIDSKTSDKSEESLAQYVNKMIKDVKVAHRNREEQLSQAAQNYRARLEGVVKRHEELLCAYRDLRSQVETLDLDELVLGPDEHELIILDADLQSSQQKEILRLQSELHNFKMNKQIMSNSGGRGSTDPNTKDRTAAKTPQRPATSTFADLNSWTSVRKELRNFSERSLRELEEERASLLTKNVILEEQLKESQDYIDKHLARYKEEISRLRQQLDYQNRG